MSVLLAAVLVSGDRVGACSCIGGVPACARAGAQAPAAIFVGQVLDIEVTQDSRLRVRLQMTESFRGGASGQVDVFTSPGDDASCGYFPFQPGDTYLVYASRNAAGQLATGICTGTARLDQVPETDLAWLRTDSQQPEALPSIQGTIRHTDAVGAQGGVPVLPAATRIVAVAEGREYETLSGSDGTFRITAPPGVYTVSADLPPGLHAAPLTVRLAEGAACSYAVIGVRLNGRIAGRLVDEHGFPAAHVTIDALPVPGSLPLPTSMPVSRATSDLEGRYELDQLRPGRYALSVDTRTRENAAGLHVLYPGTREAAAAQAVDVGAGARVTVPDFRLPAGLDLVTITGTVRNAAGQPLERVQVLLAFENGTPWAAARTVVTDTSGEFRLAVPAGRAYRLRAERAEQGRSIRRADVPAFEAVPGMPPIDVVLPDR